MTYYEMALNIINSDMDIHLKQNKIGELKNQAIHQKFMCDGFTLFCIIFGITILPLLLLPGLIKNSRACKKQIKQIDELLASNFGNI